MKQLDLRKLSEILLMIGALNWGCVGAFNINFIVILLKGNQSLIHMMYISIGLAGLFILNDGNTSGKKK